MALYNLARVTTATTGTGTITLGTAVDGFRTFAQAGVPNGATVTYSIRDGSQSEIGRGVYTLSGTTLTRSVLISTNSNAAINLSGSAEVMITAAAEDFADAKARANHTGTQLAATISDLGAATGYTPEQFGCAGDGTTNDTTNFAAAITAVSALGGGAIRCTKKYLLDSITLPRNVWLVGDGIGITPMQPLSGVSAYTYRSQLRLRSGATINMGQSTGIRGMTIIRDGLAPMAPTTNAEAITLVGTFAGQAITGSGVYFHLADTAIFGFEYAINCDANNGVVGQGGCSLFNCHFDCLNGPLMTDGGNNATWDACMSWPYLTAAVATATTATVTVTIATPAVVTWTGHGFTGGEVVVLTTTGALPTGLTADTVYYVLATGLTANTFQLAATSGGAAINTTGSQSGTHTGRSAMGLRRGGYGYRLLGSASGGNDWTTLNNCFAYGYNIDFAINDCSGVNLIGCQADGGSTGTVAGFQVSGTMFGAIQLTGCRSVSPIIGVQYNLTDATQRAHLRVVGCDFEGVIAIQHIDGVMIVDACTITDSTTGIMVGASANNFSISNIYFDQVSSGIVIDASWAGDGRISNITCGTVTTPLTIPTAVFDQVEIVGVANATSPFGNTVKNLSIYDTNAVLSMRSTTAPSNEKDWDIAATSSGTLLFRWRTDDAVTYTSWLTVDRTGSTSAVATMNATKLVNSTTAHDATLTPYMQADNFEAIGAGPSFILKNTSGGSNDKYADILLTTTTFEVRFLNDAYNEAGNILSATRSGTTITDNQIGGAAVKFPSITTTASAANAFLDSGASNSLLRSTSSLAYKTDVEPLDAKVAARVLDLQPIWYRSTAAADRGDWSWYGLAAEEVAKIDPRLVHWGYHDDDFEVVDIATDDGPVTKSRQVKAGAVKKPDGVQYERLGVLLIAYLRENDPHRYAERLAEAKAILAGEADTLSAHEIIDQFPLVAAGIGLSGATARDVADRIIADHKTWARSQYEQEKNRLSKAGG